MPAYKIKLLGDDGSLRREEEVECAHDDEAIDRTGEIDYPEAITVWQGDRLVARFPPWRQTGFARR